jgi:hypothetical protein
MLYIIHAEPQFVLKEELLLTTKKGEYYLEEGRTIGLLRTEDGRMFIGTGEEGSDQLEITGKIAATTLLELLEPSTFELALDSDGDSYIKAVFLEQKVSINEKIQRITSINESTINTNNIIPVIKIEKL